MNTVDHSDTTAFALVHEWLESRSGSEKTFEQLAGMFPQADLFALTVTDPDRFLLNRNVQTTWLQSVGALRRRRDLALPLMPIAWKTLRPASYDVVISSSHAFARYFPIGDAVHLSYVYTPLRYAWLPNVDGRGSSRLLAPARAALRGADRRTVPGVRAFAGISNVVRERIEVFYGREAAVVFPPVDIGFFREEDVGWPAVAPNGPFLLAVSRWIPYKRMDLVIAAGERVGLPVVLAGGGPLATQLAELASGATVPVSLVENPSDVELRSLYRAASVVVFPPEEDFGIVPVEAQAAGTPVVALGRGGSLDTVRDGVTGVLVEEQEPLEFARAIEAAERLSPDLFPDHVEQFSVDSFRESFRRWVELSLP